jgi:hypothetical protein
VTTIRWDGLIRKDYKLLEVNNSKEGIPKMLALAIKRITKRETNVVEGIKVEKKLDASNQEKKRTRHSHLHLLKTRE